jgi:peroxiredoxin
LLGQHRPAFILPDLDHHLRDIAEWDGQTLIVNFWATWCPPCREEIPAFMRAREKFTDQNLEIIGIAIDQPDMVSQYAAEMGISYPLLYGQMDASEVNRLYGNTLGALPYTVFIDAAGKIRHIHARGALTDTELDVILAEILGNPVLASN